MVLDTAYSALDALRQEHRLIERVLDALERFREDPAAVPMPVWGRALDFLSRYADGLHHAKEEDVLFPLLRERGLPAHGGPVGCMIHDHETGRELRRTMALELPQLGVDPDSATRLAARTAEYVTMMRFHIHKEDQILFPLADSLVDAMEQRRLAVQFDHASAKAMTPEEIRIYTDIADELGNVAEALAGLRPSAPLLKSSPLTSPKS